MIKSGCVYIMTNKSKSTLYVGVTSDLKRRVYEHKNHLIKGSFSDKYNLEYFVYYEFFDSIEEAIKMEKN
jgi:putative endonuclease